LEGERRDGKACLKVITGEEHDSGDPIRPATETANQKNLRELRAAVLSDLRDKVFAGPRKSY
jgi:hypothetical protein